MEAKRALKMTKLRLELALDVAASRFADPAQVQWLFIATLPNSGSTALAQLLSSARAAVMLNEEGEGQWLVPEMSDARWDAGRAVDLDVVRRAWMGRVRMMGVRPCLVIEKSPPSLVRFREVVRTFSDMPHHVVSLTRDPYAVCASWGKRYGPQYLRRYWGVDMPTDDRTSPEFYHVLGQLFGQRARMLLAIEDVALSVSYEQVTAEPEATLARFRALSPLLADADPKALLRVKDYGALELENMNDRQTAKLSDAQIAAISEGLQPFAGEVRAMGYALR